MSDSTRIASAPPTVSTGAAVSSPAESAAFVLCVENNETRDQALLLIESLRAFGGRFSGCPVFAVAPRAGLGVDGATRKRLDSLAVTYHEAPLNTVCPDYPTANRIYAAAWAAEVCAAETLFVVDSDTLFLGEPEPLGSDFDLAARPVDLKGSATRGAGDEFDGYWAAVCDLAGMSIESLPFVETVLDRIQVRASYNGGYAVVRRESGILQRTAELFTRSVHAGLRTYKDRPGHRVFASTGYVSPRASEYWGAGQATLAIAAWSTTQRVRLLDRRFDVPLHELAGTTHWNDGWLDLDPVHLHYHWMLRSAHRDAAFATMAELGVAADRLAWLAERTPLGMGPQSPPPVRAPAPLPATSRQLVISGMHRSGTSLVASVLRAAGLEIGRELNGPGPGNRRGHFEDRDFYRLHEEMLAAAGATALSADDDFAPPTDEIFDARARTLVEQRAGFEVWGWKDPRTCLFLDYWDALLPKAGFLFLYRHPIEVALSLRRRSTDAEVRLDPWAGIRAWETYNRRLLAFRERFPERCFLAQVPALTADPPGFVSRLAERLSLPLHAVETAGLFDPSELAAEAEWPHLLASLPDLMPGTLALYGRLETAADLPSSWPCGSPAARRTASAREPRRAVEALLGDLRAARLAPSSAEASGSRPGAASGEHAPEPSRWTAVDRRRLARLLAEGAAGRHRVAELERGLADAMDRRDVLAANLSALEGSSSYRLLAAWWRLASRFRRRGGGPGARGRTPV